MNKGELFGAVDDYPEADWSRRREIAKRHREHGLGLLYFLQNDDDVPWQFYVREARRIEGRTTFTEGDARHAEGLDRAPINEDAIAIAEYPMDSHGCRPVHLRGVGPEGHFKLDEVTVPSQVPYRTLLPEGVDNLLVPVALSATHVGFGTIRLEPTWWGIGEAAGTAAVLSRERDELPGELDASVLQRTLAEDRSTLTFFEDFDGGTDEPWVPAVQYLGTKGYFRGYTARADEPLDPSTADRWAETAADLLAGTLDATDRARTLPATADAPVEPVTGEEFVARLSAELPRGESDRPERALSDLNVAPEDSLSRGAACLIAYRAIAHESNG